MLHCRQGIHFKSNQVLFLSKWNCAHLWRSQSPTNQAFVRNQSYESLLSCCLLNIFQLRPKWAVSPLAASPSQWRAESSRHNGKNCFSPFLTWYLWILYLCICLFVYLSISVFVYLCICLFLYFCACIRVLVFVFLYFVLLPQSLSVGSQKYSAQEQELLFPFLHM